MRNRRKPLAFEAVRFLGPDPASSPFQRLFTAALSEAKAFLQQPGTTFGVVSDTKTGARLFEFPPRQTELDALVAELRACGYSRLLSDQAANAIESLRERVAKAEAECATLRNKLDGALALSSALGSENDHLRAELANLKPQDGWIAFHAMREELSKTQAERDEFRDELNDHDCSELAEERDAALQERDDLRRSIGRIVEVKARAHGRTQAARVLAEVDRLERERAACSNNLAAKIERARTDPMSAWEVRE